MTLFAALVVAVVVAVVAHEAGHVVAARIVGAKRVRVAFGWPVVRTEADVPADRWRQLVFLLAGSITNVAVAVLALAASDGVVAVVSVVFAAVNLVPHGTSDGARVLALLRGTRAR
jgi:membrane-associated protease RseP (regulator of RpoE activity)